MNKDTQQFRIPPPIIIFDGKDSLKRKSRGSHILWLSLSAAAIVAVGVMVIIPVTQTTPVATQQITAQSITVTSTPIDTVTKVEPEKTQQQKPEVKPNIRVVNRHKSVANPPPEKTNTQEHIEQIRRRELPADIPVQLNSCIAEIQTPATIIRRTVEAKEVGNKNLIVNTNIMKFIESITPQKSDDGISISAFKKREPSEDYEIIHLFSKK